MAEEFTVAPIRRLLKKAGNLRLNENAVEAMRQEIGQFGLKLAEVSVENAVNDGRKTVLERDIKNAAVRLWVPEEINAEKST